MNRRRHKEKLSVIRIGDGLGFVIDHRGVRLVVTAAHCLPSMPPPIAASNLEERTYGNLLAPLGKKPRVWAECLFVNPVADIAVLGSPDTQDLFKEAAAYDALKQQPVNPYAQRRQ